MKDLASSGSQNLGMAIAMLIVSIASVGLRFFVRIYACLPLILADWLIIPALVGMVIYLGVFIGYIVAGPGPGSLDIEWMVKHADNDGADWTRVLLKDLVIIEVFYTITITFLKLSILALYHQLFGVSKQFQVLNIGTAVACLVWFLVMFFMSIFQCWPVHMFWDSYVSSDYCLSSTRIWLGAEFTNLILDLIILFLPVIMISRLRLTPGKKLYLCGIFLLGGIACAASVAKLGITWRPQWSRFIALPQGMMLMSLQLGLAFLCACLPTYVPLLHSERLKARRSDRGYDSDSIKRGWRFSPRKGTRDRNTSAHTGADAGPYTQIQDHMRDHNPEFEQHAMGNMERRPIDSPQSVAV